MLRALSILLAILVLASSTALAQPPDKRPVTPGSQDGEDRPRDRRPAPAPLGAFELATPSRALGSHVTFDYNDTGVYALTAGGRTLMDIVVEGDADEERRTAHPVARQDKSVIKVRSANYTFTAHDNPTAASRLSTEGSWRVIFARDVAVSREGEERVRFRAGDLTGLLRGDDISVSGNEVRGDEDLLILLEKPRGEFDVHHRDLGEAITKKRIGAEATFNRGDDDEVEEAVVSYANVTMTTVRAEEGNLTVLIDGHGFDGRVIVLNVDGRVIGADAREELEVRLDNLSIVEASGLVDILDPDDDGYQPEYYIVFDPNVQAFQLIVTLPHYSVHTLSVTTAIILPPAPIVIGVLAGIALLVPTAVVLFRRK